MGQLTPELRHSPRAQVIPWLGILGTLGCILFIVLVSYLRFTLKTVPFGGDQDLTIKKDGSVWTSKQKVGQFLPIKEHRLELRLPIDPGEFGAHNLQFNIELPDEAPATVVKASIITIQDPVGLYVYPLNPNQLAVVLNNLLTDAHTVIVLDASDSAFQLPSLIYFYYWLLALPILIWYGVCSAILLFVTTVIIWRLHRPRIKPANQRLVPPDELTPLEIAILLHSKLEPHHIAAAIFDLAQRGFLQIIDNGKEIYLFRSNPEKPLYPYEAMLLDMLSPPGQKPPALQEVIRGLNGDIFSAVVSELYIEVYDSLTAQDYFRDNVRLIHVRYKTFGIVVQLLALMEIFVVYFWSSPLNDRFILLGLAAYGIGYILYQTGYHILPLTDKGFQSTLESLAFGQYLQSTDPIGPRGQQGVLFFKYLAYAQVLHCEAGWLQRFRKTSFLIPNWFFYAGKEFFHPIDFLNEVAIITNLIGSIMVKVKDPNVD